MLFIVLCCSGLLYCSCAAIVIVIVLLLLFGVDSVVVECIVVSVECFVFSAIVMFMIGVC